MAENLAVLGAGSWGIAVANLLSSNGHRVALWEFNHDDFQTLFSGRTHPRKLPGIKIAQNVRITNELPEAVSGSDCIVLVVPAQTMRQVCRALKHVVDSPKSYINLAKGIEVGTLARMSEVIRSEISYPESSTIATLSGPSHAEEVAVNLPTTVVVASEDANFAGRVQELFNNQTFRVYRSSDLVGVELGGSLKNVIAIASGITQGLGFGDNTTGALITRGLAEITRIGIKLGAAAVTFAGLSGIGDLVTTCISRHSRNRYVGDKIGRGEGLNDVVHGMAMVAEGVDTCRSAKAISEKYKVEMPITAEVYKVLFENKPPAEAVADLMGRSLKEEVWN